MKGKRYISIGILIVFATLILFAELLSRKTASHPVPGSCTIFSASVGDKVLFGNNEDYNDPKTYFWTEPASDENLGAVYLGFENYSYQGGVNERGLCFDANALPDSKINPHTELSTPPLHEPPYEEYAYMGTCAYIKNGCYRGRSYKNCGAIPEKKLGLQFW